MKSINDEDVLPINTAQTTKTTIFYYTGTGNSLWAARVLARELGNTELMCSRYEDGNFQQDA
ncbi:MAG TPA: hypothetical protein VIM51_10660 [Desulfosporosinus sp.]